MLETKNLSKIYKPKKGVPVTALDKISLRFPDKGMIFLLGKSGSGKSTLLNALLDLQLETGEISEKIQRGKNTTRYAQLLIHDGIRVLDTAGFSLLETEKGMEPEKLQELYPEFHTRAVMSMLLFL